jgi:hypothetical protein
MRGRPDTRCGHVDNFCWSVHGDRDLALPRAVHQHILGPIMPDRIRSLADALRSWDDSRLATLLSARPDLSRPLPHGVGPLAARAAAPDSVRHALQHVDAAQHAVLDALTRLPSPVTAAQVSGELRLPGTDTEDGPEPDDTATPPSSTPATQPTPPTTRQIQPLIDALCALALVWEQPSDEAALFHLVRPVRDLLKASDARPHSGDASGPATSPAVPAAPMPIELPLTPPPLAGTPVAERFPGSRTAGAVEHALEVVRTAGVMLRPDTADGPGVLRRGGIPQRDLKHLAEREDVPAGTLVTAIHSAWLAGWIGHDGASWLPTADGLAAASAPESARWAELVLTWVAGDDLPSLVGTPDPKGQPRPALSPALARPGARRRRTQLLRILDQTHDVGPAALVARLGWEHPRLPAGLGEQEVRALLTEGNALGVLEGGSLTVLGSALVDALDQDLPSADATLRAAFDAHAPEPVDEVLIGADLTVIVPGRPSARLRVLQDWSETVSRGGGTTLRLTAASVRRGLSLGRDGDQLLALLEDASRTPLPQPLTYLIRDEQRRQGRVLIGTASSYLTGDEDVLALALEREDLAELGLHRIAPTVLVTHVDPLRLARTLRRAGLAPATVGPDGEVVQVRRPVADDDMVPLTTARSEGHRSAPWSPRRSDGEDAARITARRIRDLDGAGTPPSTVDQLLDAIAHEQSLRIGIVDGRGGTEHRTVLPVALEGGRLRARDVDGDREFTVLVHRVTLE